MFHQVREIICYGENDDKRGKIRKTIKIMAIIRGISQLPESELNRRPHDLRTLAAERLIRWDNLLMKKNREMERKIKELRSQVRKLKKESGIEQALFDYTVDKLKEEIQTLKEKLEDTEAPYTAPREYFLPH